MRKLNNKRIIRNRFHRALLHLQQRTGWDAKKMASHYDLPHRSVLNWLRGKTSPGPRRLKELCNIFGWEHAALFECEGRDEMFERKHLNLETLNRHYLSLQVRNPLEAWAYVALAGAIDWVEKFKTERITMTFPVLNSAAEVIVLVSGAEKAPIVAETLDQSVGEPRYPIQRVRPRNGIKHWMPDAAAAASITAMLH